MTKTLHPSGEMIDMDKLPKWWRGFRGDNRTLCNKGLHVPVRVGNTDEVFCQNCMISLTMDNWNNFFKRAK